MRLLTPNIVTLITWLRRKMLSIIATKISAASIIFAKHFADFFWLTWLRVIEQRWHYALRNITHMPLRIICHYENKHLEMMKTFRRRISPIDVIFTPCIFFLRRCRCRRDWCDCFPQIATHLITSPFLSVVSIEMPSLLAADEQGWCADFFFFFAGDDEPIKILTEHLRFLFDIILRHFRKHWWNILYRDIITW